MDQKPDWHGLVERVKNFHGNHESFLEQAYENDVFYSELQGLNEGIATDIGNHDWLDREQILKLVFTRVFSLAVMSDKCYMMFEENSPFYSDVFDACYFTSLCMFLHHTKRIKGQTIREFLYSHSPLRYFDKQSKYHFNLKKMKVSKGYDKILGTGHSQIYKDAETFRKMRNRLLSVRDVYIIRPEWSAMPMSSEHEWAYYFAISKLNDDLFATYKRIGNLYNGINKELNTQTDDEYPNRLENEYKKFLSKLRKIKYDKFLELQKVILAYICQDKKYFGMNLYRFEKLLRLFNITHDVNSLLECQDETALDNVLRKSIALNNLYFPKLYLAYSSYDDPNYIEQCVKVFTGFMDVVVSSSRLLLDEYVEKGYFKDNWEALFLNTINEMAERVFYNPNMINYSVKPGSQEKFEMVISAPIHDKLSKIIDLKSYWPPSAFESDDEI